MNNKFSRSLNDQDQVEHFLNEVLALDHSGFHGLSYRIVSCEHGIGILDSNAETLYNRRFRDRDYKEDAERWQLRRQIVDELLNLERLDDDEDICLGAGGALPKSGVRAERQAYILIGLPASGKSCIATIIAERYGAIVVDADYAKRKLPEYSSYIWGASAVHQESNQIVNGFENTRENISSVLDISLQAAYNMVIPKIGKDADSLYRFCQSLRSKGYTVHLTLVALLKKKATIRAIQRFHTTKRYIPLGYIFDDCGNDPSLTYFVLKNKKQDEFSSFGVISTDVPMGMPYICTDILGNNPANLFEFKSNILI
jgi:hypothetical protein